MQCIQFFAMFLLMLVTGVFWGPWLSLHRSMKDFNEEEFMRLVKMMAANLASPMRLLMPVCIVLILMSVWVYPQKESLGFYLNIAALGFALLSLLITILVEVPIVTRIKTWTLATIPEDWTDLRDRWLKFHVFRTISALAGFATLIASVLQNG